MTTHTDTDDNAAAAAATSTAIGPTVKPVDLDPPQASTADRPSRHR
ncbi:MAG: hypothetical protein OES24_07615 [Acidimicrobiia bacterium]|nr:hypothetical protein [Acidimicrobiia bacterium]